MDEKDLRAKNSCQAWQKAARKHNDINEKTMTTLKQILEINLQNYPEKSYQLMLKSVKAWLQQEQTEYLNKSYETQLNINIFNELLEDLET